MASVAGALPRSSRVGHLQTAKVVWRRPSTISWCSATHAFDWAFRCSAVVAPSAPGSPAAGSSDRSRRAIGLTWPSSRPMSRSSSFWVARACWAIMGGSVAISSCDASNTRRCIDSHVGVTDGERGVGSAGSVVTTDGGVGAGSIGTVAVVEGAVPTDGVAVVVEAVGSVRPGSGSERPLADRPPGADAGLGSLPRSSLTRPHADTTTTSARHEAPAASFDRITSW